jgi:nucleoid DNA-binding protein
MAKAAATAKKALTKSELMANIAEATELSKKQVGEVLDALGAEIKKSLSSKGAGAITIPGLIKIAKQNVPAKPARFNVPDPFNKGQFRDYPAKKATTKVKVRALKTLKDWVK